MLKTLNPRGYWNLTYAQLNHLLGRRRGGGGHLRLRRAPRMTYHASDWKKGYMFLVIFNNVNLFRLSIKITPSKTKKTIVNFRIRISHGQVVQCSDYGWGCILAQYVYSILPNQNLQFLKQKNCKRIIPKFLYIGI